MDRLISELVAYGLNYHLVHVDDKTYVINRLRKTKDMPDTFHIQHVRIIA